MSRSSLEKLGSSPVWHVLIREESRIGAIQIAIPEEIDHRLNLKKALESLEIAKPTLYSIFRAGALDTDHVDYIGLHDTKRWSLLSRTVGKEIWLTSRSPAWPLNTLSDWKYIFYPDGTYKKSFRKKEGKPVFTRRYKASDLYPKPRR